MNRRLGTWCSMAAWAALLWGWLGCGALWAQSAIGQLEGMTGARINRFQYHGMPRGGAAGVSAATANLGAMMTVSGMLGNLLGEAIAMSITQGARQQQEVQARAEMEAWAQAERERLHQLVTEQRARRDAEEKTSLEEMAQAFSDFYDGSNLARRDPGVVDLRDRTREDPRIPGMPPPAARQADTLAVSRTLLEDLVKENKQAEVLYRRLREQEARLSELMERAMYLRDRGAGSEAEFRKWESEVRACLQRTSARGVALALEGLFDRTDWSLKLLKARLGEVKTDSKLWHQTLNSLQNVNDFVESGVKITETKDDFDWATGKRDLLADMEYAVDRIAPQSQWNWHWTLGKNIVGNSVDVMRELHALYRIAAQEGVTAGYLRNVSGAHGQMRGLVAQLRRTRAQLAQETGLSEEQLTQLTMKRPSQRPWRRPGN